MTANPALIAHLVAANHILDDHGVVDALGDVSVRHDKRPDCFLLARNIAPGSVMASDILEFHVDGSPVDPQGRRPYLERFIHSEIYAARPDVMAIVHSHSHSIVPLSISVQHRLRAVVHMAGFIGPEAPLFEIRDMGGTATDLLIRSPELGRALAKSLAGHIVVMRGHGSTVTAASLPSRRLSFRLCRAQRALPMRGYASWSNNRPYRRGGRRLCSLDRRAGSSAVGIVDPGSRRAPPCSRSGARLSGSTSQAATCDLAPRRCEAS